MRPREASRVGRKKEDGSGSADRRKIEVGEKSKQRTFKKWFGSVEIVERGCCPERGREFCLSHARGRKC